MNTRENMWSAASFRGVASRSTIAAVSKVTSAQGSTAAARTPVPSSFWASRTFSSSFTPSPLDAFRDSVDRETRGAQPVGRPWAVAELRRKSYEDLHKLWYVLYMERNMLLTEQQLSRRRQIRFPQPQRIKKVQKSMQGIKQVLGERKRQRISDYNSNKLGDAMEAESDAEEIEVTAEK